jgi:hypothetical protein
VSGGDEHLSDAELAAFADGTLPDARRPRVVSAVARSARLRAQLEEQRLALAAVRGLDVPAPARLRARVLAERGAAQRAERPSAAWLRGRRGRALVAAGLSTAIAATLLVALLVAGGTRPPSVAEVASLAERGATGAAPGREPGQPALLRASVSGVAFPAYGPKLGWRAAGVRADDLRDRQTRTVYYARGGERVAYAIVSGAALAWPAGARRTMHGEIELRALERRGRTIVTWRREGKTCVLSSRQVGRRQLLALAVWNGDGAVSF